METEPQLIPDEAVKGIASGLFMMAAFTLIWAGIAFGGLHTSPYAFALVVFAVLAITFVTRGISIYKLAKQFPMVESEEDKAEGKKMGMWFGIIFGLEGLFIFIAVNVVINIGHPELTIPAIALIVGLHFYPLAKVFKRTVDYYLATWSTLVAIAAILLSLNKVLTQPGVMAFTGIGLAVATSCYGLHMMKEGSKLAKQVAP
ncbi:hypothetical protein KXD93_27900 [Mucilaginibacter sp. BJC16-A38]|uniref:DUF7010 family protein n=1 Tax=Mucilaginibacter phenanthrenivorans TaxID=1234842 RepID=UPI002157D9CC|nr:hypothetical protein [Mucilaginibacter phenanthrenivorans]MCR8561510.1 hypothetical protein [Mucilaginibacter phenanthrenivorans]